VFFFLPDSPATAKFLTADEQTLAIERLQMRDTTAKSKVDWKQFRAGILDWKTYVHALIQFSWNYSFASLSNFLPTIISSMGYKSITAQGLTAPPYFGAFLCCIAVAFISDRWGKRGPLIAFLGCVSLVGYLILTLVSNEQSVGARYGGIWFTCCGVFPIAALNLTWILNNLGSDSKRGGSIAVVATIGQLTSFLGSAVFPNKFA
jgi:MFS family permease